ncbi:MAG TPA: SURF1 family protein [Acidimicrobiales bacterium]|nr:SURF1 family protein [Acidimicrobiales bacterium]
MLWSYDDVADENTRSYAFAREPRWIVGHVLVLIAIVVMVNLGLWQLRRLDERRDANELVLSRSNGPAVALSDLPLDAPADVEFRRVAFTGTFDADHEVLVGYRTNRGLPGYHVITPLVGADGDAVLVNRGFVPLSFADDWPVADAAPPAGEVRVVGLLRRSLESRTKTIDAAAAEDATPVLNNVDVPVIDRYVPADVVPMFVELQEPRTRGFPEPLPDLDLGEGSHFSYAVQWFLFTTVAVIGWPIILRRRAIGVNARTRHRERTA